MATWIIEQKTEVWYRTYVEADTFEEAINQSDESSDWERLDEQDWSDDYWGENQDTGQQFTSTNGSIREEK